MRLAVYHIANGDISLKITTIYDIILSKEGAIMSENKLSFEFAVAIVNLVDGVTAPEKLLYDRSTCKSRHIRWC